MAALSLHTVIPEMLLEIAHYLPVEDYYNLCKVSRNTYILLQDGLLVKDAQSSNPRALLWAVEHGNLFLASTALDAGSDARMTYEHGYKTKGSDTVNVANLEVLYLAIKKNHTKIARLLHSYGAQAERVARPLTSYLDMAIMHDNPDTVDICLKSLYTDVFNLNNLFWSGLRPLQEAVKHRRTNAVRRLLLDSRVQVRGALTTACKVKTPSHAIIELLVAQKKEFEANETGFALRRVCRVWTQAQAMAVVPNLLNRPIDEVDLYDSLSAACEGGYFGIVKLILSAHGHLSSFDRATLILAWRRPVDPPLVAACTTGRVDLVEYLCDQGFKVDEPSSDGNLPIHSAATKGHMDVIKPLRSRGADLDARDNLDRSCLELAIEKSRRRRFEDLLQLGCDPMQRKSDGSTLLWTACKLKNCDMIERLIELNVPIDATNSQGHTVFFNLFWQYTKANSSILKLLLRHLTEKQISVFEMNFLSIAVNAQDTELVMALLANCHKEEARPSIVPVFHEACQFNQRDIIEVMLSHDSTLAITPNTDGYLPIYHLLNYGDSGKDSLRLLLQCDANANLAVSTTSPMHELFSSQLDTKDSKRTPWRSNVLSDLQRYPLHFSCSRGDIDVAILLAQYGAEIDRRDNCNMTALHHACMHNQYRCAEILLRHGSDTTACYSIPHSDTNYTPYKLAIDNDATEMIELLIRHDEERERKKMAEESNQAE